jgi:hypothetical protein
MFKNLLAQVLIIWQRLAIFAWPVSLADRVIPTQKENAIFRIHAHTRFAIEAPEYFSAFITRVLARYVTFGCLAVLENFVFFQEASPSAGLFVAFDSKARFIA